MLSTASGPQKYRRAAVPPLLEHHRECSTGPIPFKGSEKLIDEPGGALPQVAQDARLGDENGVDSQTQLDGDGVWR